MAASGEIWPLSRGVVALDLSDVTAGPFSCFAGINSEFHPVRPSLHEHGEEFRVIKRFAPIGLILAAACGGGGDGTGAPPPSSDISTMAVGDVRVMNSTDSPDGLDRAAGGGRRASH